MAIKFSLLNLFLVLTILALILVIYKNAIEKDPVVVLQMPSRSMAWEIRKSIISQTPDWHDLRQPPPLPLGDAISKAESIADAMNQTTIRTGRWSLVSIAAMPLDNYSEYAKLKKWCYVAQFAGSYLPPDGKKGWATSGPPPEFTAMILMDGTIVAGDGKMQSELVSAISNLEKAHQRDSIVD